MGGKKWGFLAGLELREARISGDSGGLRGGAGGRRGLCTGCGPGVLAAYLVGAWGELSRERSEQTEKRKVVGQKGKVE